MTWDGTVERSPGDVPGVFCALSLLYVSRMSLCTPHFSWHFCAFSGFLIHCPCFVQVSEEHLNPNSRRLVFLESHGLQTYLLLQLR